MGLRLVNTSPGSAPEPVKPGQPVQLGLKSESDSVDLGSVRISMGLTSVHHEGLLPEENPNLESRGATVTLETPERARPITGEVSRDIVGGHLRFQKASTHQEDLSIYEIKTDIKTGSPVLGYWEFLVDSSWARTSRPWSLERVAGVFLGLEHGNFNNACYAFLGDGVLHAGGVLPAWDTGRPGHRALAFDWSALPDGTRLGIWIYYNVFGYPPPFSPSYTPVVEVWVSVAGAPPVRQCRIPVGELGVFPKPAGNTTNSREAPDDVARLFFGFSGNSGESLVLTDWALFPDYRVAVNEGMPLPGNEFRALPDGPVEYKASSGMPADQVPGRWFALSDAGAGSAAVAPAFVPGQKRAPTFVSLKKTLSKLSGFEKLEPRLEAHQGFMVEAFVAGFQTTRVSDQFGGGFLVQDGAVSCRVSLLEESTGKKTVGLLFDNSTPAAYWAYLQSSEVDWNSLKRVRLSGDYERDRVSLFVEDEFVGERELSSMPASALPGRVAFGHLSETDSRGELQVASLTYLSRFKAWEGRDGLLPKLSPNAFTKMSAGESVESMLPATLTDHGRLLLDKKAFSTSGSELFYTRPEDFEETNGVLVDFKVRVNGYTDKSGKGLAARCQLGCGLELNLGSKKLHLGFFDCGSFGKMVGIIPGSGTADDIVRQTELGQAFSAAVDWTVPHSYRIVYKAYDRIEVWIDNVAGASVIRIPWVNGCFDLPEDFGEAAIRFGHFSSQTSSATEWWYVRFGQSNGFEVAVQQKYGELPSYLFGGRAVVLTEFDE